jgi:hypothetical protein
VVTILLYRNAKFNKYYKLFLKKKYSLRELINTIMSWENVYFSYIKQIELRALKQAKSNFLSKLNLLYAFIAKIPSILELA